MTAPVISVVVPGPAELAEAAASWTAERITGAVAAAAGYVTLRWPVARRRAAATSGWRGRLIATASPWASVFVYWSDERQVPLGRSGQ